MFGFGRYKDCKFCGTYFGDWIFIENFTESIFMMDRFERLHVKENNEKINDTKGASFFI